MLDNKNTVLIFSIIWVMILACNSQNKEQTSTKDTKRSTVNNNNSGDMKVIHLKKMDVLAVGESNFAVRENSENVSISDTVEYNIGTYYVIDSLYSKKGDPILFMLTGISGDHIENHDWVLMDNSIEESNVKKLLQNKRSHSEFISEMSDAIVANTKPVSNNETITINFTAPDSKGRYLYFCSNYDHFQAGMKGYFVVK